MMAVEGMNRKLSVVMLNQDWLAAELRASGHQVVTAGLGKDRLDVNFGAPEVSAQKLFESLPPGFTPDCLLWWDDSALPWLTGIENINLPTVFFSVDAHHHHEWHNHFGSMFDLVLVAQKDYLPKFRAQNPHCAWFPLWATREPETSAPRDINASFVGTLDARIHPKRTAFFERLNALTPIECRVGDYGPVYGRSKIVVNETVEGDLNFRVFEAMVCGAMLLTPKTGNGLLDIFEDGKDLVTYERDNVEDAAAKIRWYLEHEAERAAIAAEGERKVKARHSNHARAAELQAFLSELRYGARPYRYYGCSVVSLATFLVCKHEKLNWGRDTLQHGADSLIVSASRQERADSEFFGTTVLYAHFINELGLPEKALDFLRKIGRYYPYNQTLRLAAIEVLLNSGRKAEALERAKEIGSNPEEICSTVHARIADSLRNRVLEKIEEARLGAVRPR